MGTKNMKVGFTGTREGLTTEQHSSLCRWFRESTTRPTFLLHGVCFGADVEAVEAFSVCCPGAMIVAYPPVNKSMMSPTALHDSDERKPAAPYLERNHAIVDDCDVLLACPKGENEEQRSGTWATIRYARKQGKRIVILWPDGTVSGECSA